MTQRVKLRPRAMPYLIKRYANRKLYDPQTSRYVTLEDLKQLIRGGSEIRVEDAASGEDLTAATLMQVLLEAGRARQGALPPVLLHQLIKLGEAWYEMVQQTLGTTLSGRSPAAPEVERMWREWAKLAGWPAERAPEPAPAAAAARRPPLEQEIADLKAQMRALEARPFAPGARPAAKPRKPVKRGKARRPRRRR